MKLRISRLMDEYMDTEFFPRGGTAVNGEGVKERVLTRAKAPAGKEMKKQMPRKKKVLLAAALAAVMVVLMGAGFPSMIYGLVSGTLSFQQTEDERITALVHHAPLLQKEDGRLWFVPDKGERIDITDLVSEETPYIYDGSDPDANLTYYVILGGTPEFHGWFEWIAMPDPFDQSNDNGGIYTVYDYSMAGPDREEDVGGGGSGTGPVYWEAALDHPWLRAGLKELGIPVTTEQNYTVTYGQ